MAEPLFTLHPTFEHDRNAKRLPEEYLINMKQVRPTNHWHDPESAYIKWQKAAEAKLRERVDFIVRKLELLQQVKDEHAQRTATGMLERRTALGAFIAAGIVITGAFASDRQLAPASAAASVAATNVSKADHAALDQLFANSIKPNRITAQFQQTRSVDPATMRFE